MSKSTELQPALRFSGFEGNWNQNTLSSVTDVYDGTHQTPKYTDSGVMFLSAENIKTLKSKKFITENSFRKEFKIYPTKGDVLMTRIGDVGTANIVENSKPKAYYVTLALLKQKELDSYFLKASITAPFVQKDIWYRTLHIAFPKKINMNEIAQVVINTPDLKEEQTQIGNFFQNLDQQLNLHKAKHCKLQQLKKAMLAKMFPKAGASVPEIRFAGFSGDWENKAFQNSFTYVSSNILSRAELNDKTGLAMNVHYGDVLIKFTEVLDLSITKVPFITNDALVNKLIPNRLQDGDIVIADAAEDTTVGKCTEINNLGNQLLFAGLHTITVRPIIPFAPKYVGYFLNSNLYHDQLLSLMQGTKVLSISKSSIKKTLIYSPKDIAEQTKIGDYFQNLDCLIALQQQQLDKLNNIKQACLEKMFV